jgi:hypothetical protein
MCPGVKKEVHMAHTSFIAKMAFVQFALAVSIMVLVTCVPAIERFGTANIESLPWVIGALAALATTTGLLSWHCLQGNVAALRGLLLLIAIVLVIPVGAEVSIGHPAPVE